MSDRGKIPERLDQALVTRGIVETRSRARDLVLRGKVEIDGRAVTKPAFAVTGGHQISIAAADEIRMVSRGRLKLEAALDAFSSNLVGCFDPKGLVCLDAGSSTGGFTELLLERGAAVVYAVDVGTAQLHPRLAADSRVILMENRDVRTLTAEDFRKSKTVRNDGDDVAADTIAGPGAIVADISFLSLIKALPTALSLAPPDAWLIALVKPQFEVGPEHVSKSGIVRNAAVREAAVAKVAGWLTLEGWRVQPAMPSPIAGGDGNVEYLLGANRTSQ